MKNNLITSLKNCDVNKIVYLSLNGLKTFAKVINVKDGDTIEVIIFNFNNFYKYNIRLSGIDTCETRSKNDLVKNIGIKAKYRLIEILTQKKFENLKKEDIKDIFHKENIIVWVECFDFDKYGRLLANIFTYDENKDKIGKKSISDILVDEKLAYRYDGGLKLTNENQIDLLS